MIVWTSLISVYLWLAGIAGGAYFAAFLAERFNVSAENGLLKAATWMGVPAIAVGSLLLTIELGQPLRFWHLLTEFSVLSPMSPGAWLLPIWAAVGTVMIVLSWLKRAESVLRVLSWLNFFLSILLIVYSGVLLSATNQPLWSVTVLLPLLFVASALSMGVAFLMLVLLLKRQRADRTLTYLSLSDVIVFIVELVFVGAFLVGLGPARKVITTGTLGLLFWVGAVLIGILVPLGLGLRAAVRGKEDGLTLLLSTLWVLAGGLVLREVIVLGGQIFG